MQWIASNGGRKIVTLTRSPQQDACTTGYSRFSMQRFIHSFETDDDRVIKTKNRNRSLNKVKNLGFDR